MIRFVNSYVIVALEKLPAHYVLTDYFVLLLMKDKNTAGLINHIISF